MLRGFVSPELMFFQVSGNAVINVIVGGTGTLIGPLYRSALLTVSDRWLGPFRHIARSSSAFCLL